MVDLRQRAEQPGQVPGLRGEDHLMSVASSARPGSATVADAAVADPVRPPSRRTSRRVETVGAWTLCAPYVVLLLIAGVIPIGYAFVTALQTPPTPLNPAVGFGGLKSFETVITDFRFLRTFGNIASVLVIWLPIMMIGVVGLALLVHASPGRFGNAMRFIYYVPGALAGVANFVLWVYLLNPSSSPIQAFWSALG